MYTAFLQSWESFWRFGQFFRVYKGISYSSCQPWLQGIDSEVYISVFLSDPVIFRVFVVAVRLNANEWCQTLPCAGRSLYMC